MEAVMEGGDGGAFAPRRLPSSCDLSQQANADLRPLNPLVVPMLTDLYNITMAYGHWLHGRADVQATFELYFRKNPFGGEYTVFAGLEECVKFMSSFRFAQEHIQYLRQQPILAGCEDGFWEWLAGCDCSRVRVKAQREGTFCFPRIPLLVVEGPLAITQLLETTLLNCVNYASLLATNAARFRAAVGPEIKLYEFGLRRAQGPDGGISASRYSFLGGFDGTTNALAGHMCEVPLHGTMAHAFIQSFSDRSDLATTELVGPPPSKTRHDFLSLVLKLRDELGWTNTNEGELIAFIAYAQAFPTSFLVLVDTYDTVKSGTRNFLLVALGLLRAGYKPIGIRLDSGDLAYLSKVARAEFSDFSIRMGVAFRRLMIVASNDINEPTLLSLRQQGHEIDAFAVGTHLVTCQAQPALGCVYKLVSCGGKPRIKISQEVEKITVPGLKQAFRLYNSAGCPVVDLLQSADEPPPTPGTRILCRHPFQETKRAYVTPSSVQPLHTCVWDGDFTQEYAPPFLPLATLRSFVMEQVVTLREDHMRPINPTPYKVSVSSELYEKLHTIWLAESPIPDID
jgi:nicotinate phosphoribosyltransferase